MANIILDKERRLIPNWRSFGKTTVLGELDSALNINKNEGLIFGVDDYILDWKANKSISFGLKSSDGKRNNSFCFIENKKV